MFGKLTHPLLVVLVLTVAGGGWAAQNPHPTDGATDVPLTAELSWSSPWPIQYDVYFGTDLAAVAEAHIFSAEYKGRQWHTTYDPGSLTPGTTYYWRIDDVSGELIIPGPVWSFTTESVPFGIATNPNPENHATNVPVDAILSWTPAPGADSHDVYFGTDPVAVSEATKSSPEYRGRQDADLNTYDPGPLQPNQSHYWRIDSVFDMGMYSVIYIGLTWDFTTATGAESMVFAQMDFDLDGMIYTDTEWGAVDFTFIGQEPIMYFNLAVSGTWQVQNIPVLSIEGVDVEQTMTYYFDLGTERGVNVDGLDYDYMFTPDIIDAMPGGAVTATVVDRQAVFSPGTVETEIVSLSLVSAEPLIGALAKIPEKFAHKDFPNQDCGVNECCPAAVSNSLKFLNKKWSLGIKDSKTTIDDMKKATNWDKDGCWIDHDDNRPKGQRNAWWEDKKKYMEDNDYPITTRRVTDLGKIAEEIKSGQDVELLGDWHAAAIVGITDLGGGKFSIDVAHDTEQGKAGGTKTETITYDPNTKKFSGSPGFFAGSSFRYAVVECPSYYVLDGFESYLPGEILVSWTDGLSPSTDPDLPSNGTGSKVDLSTVLVHAGEQSMAFEYHNDRQWPAGFYSETSRMFETPQDWARPGMDALSLWFHGNPGNDPEQMYLGLEDENGAVWLISHDDVFAVQTDGWRPWNINLQEFSDAGVDLATVAKVCFGVGSRGNVTAPGGIGVIHYDDLRLYSDISECGLPGDLDGDCATDLRDLAILSMYWLQERPQGPWCTSFKTNQCRYRVDDLEPQNGKKCPHWLVEGKKCIKGGCSDDDDCDEQLTYRYVREKEGIDCLIEFELMDCAKKTGIVLDCREYESQK